MIRKSNIKLIIQIPCFNEEQSLPITLKRIPREFPGVDKTEILIIDDGSTDKTAEVALKLGVDHIVKINHHQGLAKAFKEGVEACIKKGADIIVNTDADNQYCGEEIAKLIEAIITGKADLVIGQRDFSKIEHFSHFKKFMQVFGSWIIGKIAGIRIYDATSGFRAFNIETALKINVLSDFTYTHETLINLAEKNVKIINIPIKTNMKIRESKLAKNSLHYLKRCISTIISVSLMRRPLIIFSILGFFIMGIGSISFLRFLYYYFFVSSQGKVQSLVFGTVLFIIGFLIILIGLIATIIKSNRLLIEESLLRIKKIEISLTKKE